MVTYLRYQEKVFRQVMADSTGIWIVGYENPGAPQIVSYSSLEKVEQIPPPEEQLDESDVSEKREATRKKRYAVIRLLAESNECIIRAVRNGWVCELQEPSLITRASVLPGLNGLMDETGYIVLPTGEMLHRHPDCILISTLNVDLEGCRPLNQSFMDRHSLIIDMTAPDDKVIIDRIQGMTGCDSSIDLVSMVDTMHQVAKVAVQSGASDGNVNSMRALASWVNAVMITGNYRDTAKYTIVSGATADAQTRAQLMTVVENKFTA